MRDKRRIERKKPGFTGKRRTRTAALPVHMKRLEGEFVAKRTGNTHETGSEQAKVPGSGFRGRKQGAIVVIEVRLTIPKASKNDQPQRIRDGSWQNAPDEPAKPGLEWICGPEKQ
jgi:hypothetical protein